MSADIATYRINYAVEDWRRITGNGTLNVLPFGAALAIDYLCNEVESHAAEIARLTQELADAGAAPVQKMDARAVSWAIHRNGGFIDITCASKEADEAMRLGFRVENQYHMEAPVQAQGVLTDERELFEAHIRSLNPDVIFVERWPNSGDYKHHSTSGWWRGWQARATLAAQAPASDALYLAVERLIKAKGRFHTERNYKAVVEAFDGIAALKEQK